LVVQSALWVMQQLFSWEILGPLLRSSLLAQVVAVEQSLRQRLSSVTEAHDQTPFIVQI
jgi:hypothetical protein